MKKVIVPNGDILFVNHITRISKIYNNTLYSHFNIFYVGSDSCIEIKSTPIDIRIKLKELIDFMDSTDPKEILLDFQDLSK